MDIHYIRERLDSWNKKLAVIEQALQQELHKKYNTRDRGLLLFLYREQIVCTNVISELNTLVEKEGAEPRAVSLG